MLNFLSHRRMCPLVTLLIYVSAVLQVYILSVNVKFCCKGVA
jgi:hypothetical protein